MKQNFNNKEQDIEKRTYKFGVEVIKAVKLMPQNTSAFVLGKQLIRSATSINSNIVHAQSSLTKKEFIYFMNNAKKEAKETKNWLLMAVDSELLKSNQTIDLLEENEEMIKILVKSVMTAQKNS